MRVWLAGEKLYLLNCTLGFTRVDWVLLLEVVPILELILLCTLKSLFKNGKNYF